MKTLRRRAPAQSRAPAQEHGLSRPRWCLAVVSAFIALAAAPAGAGPPFMIDDPDPTETGHWEIYAPVADFDGRGSDFAGSTGAEINYGAAPGVQLTLGLPLAMSHDRSGWQTGAGDIEGSVKLRVINNARSHVRVALFPGLTLPTATHGLGAGRVTGFVPVWAQYDRGPWSVFGGGGYAINPGAGRSDYWTGAIALSRAVGPKLVVGIEARRRGADEVGGSGETSLGIGVIRQLHGALRLLASGGPSFDDAGGPAGYHGFVAFGLYF